MNWKNIHPNNGFDSSNNNRIIFIPRTKKLLFVFDAPIEGVENSRGGVFLFEGVEYIRKDHFYIIEHRKEIFDNQGYGILYENLNSSLINALGLSKQNKFKHYLTFTCHRNSLEIIANNFEIINNDFTVK